MRLATRFLSLLLIITNITLFCGCWNYEDIEKMVLVAGFAIDKNENGDKYLITLEIVDFEMSGKEAKQINKYIESEGSTIFDAIRNAIDIVGKRMYWAHSKIVIVSQDIAKEGISQVLDMLVRDAEMREEMYILISTEKTAKEVLKQEMILSQTSSINIENMLTNQKSVGHTPAIRVYEFMGILEEEGISAVLPSIHLTKISDKITAELDGAAIFKSDKLVGFLDIDDTRSYLFIINKITGGLITINEASSNKMDNITLEISRSKTKVKPEVSNKKLNMNIEIKTEAALGEIGTPVEYTQKGNQDKLKKHAEDKVKASVEKLIKKVQNDFDTDIFGFGRITKANMPSVWRSAQKDGANLFKEIKTNVKVDIELRNSALTKKTIKKGD